MQGLTGRHLSEIFGLTVMIVMIAALIASQAGATVHETVRSDATYTEAAFVQNAGEISRATIIHADLEIQVDFARLLEAGFDTVSGPSLPDLIEVRMTLDD